MFVYLNCFIYLPMNGYDHSHDAILYINVAISTYKLTVVG